MSAREIRADFSRTCEGSCQGYHIGTVYFLPYVPAWCPKMAKETEK